MSVKAMDLFDAYQKSALPKEEGYLVSSYFSTHTAYSRYDIISYANVKSIYPSDDGLTFQTDGKKLCILCEPANYHQKGIEPYVRATEEQIPLRFNELDVHTCKNQTKIYTAKKAIITYGSFTVMRPKGMNFSFVFYKLPDVLDSMALFFEKTFNKEAGVPLNDAKTVSKVVMEKIKTNMGWDFGGE
jgi:hypothetical protein